MTSRRPPARTRRTLRGVPSDDVSGDLSAIRTYLENRQGLDQQQNASLEVLDRKFSAFSEIVSSNHDDLRDDHILLHDTIDLSVSKLRRELRSCHREIDSLRRLLGSNGPPRFPLFIKLPTEIRAMIWDYASPRRVVTVEEVESGGDDGAEQWSTYLFKPRRSPPAVAHVCQESRAIVCRAARIFPIRNSLAPLLYRLGAPDLSFETAYPETQWSWFDSSRDTLHLKMKLRGFRSPINMKEILRAAESIAIDSPRYTDSRFLRHLFNPLVTPNLASVDLVDRVMTLPENSDPYIESHLFGTDRTGPIAVNNDHPQALTSFLYRLSKTRNNFAENLHKFSSPNSGPEPTDVAEREAHWGNVCLAMSGTWHEVRHRSLTERSEAYREAIPVSEETFEMSSSSVNRETPRFQRVCLFRLGKWDEAFRAFPQGPADNFIT
ncbi:hypothetical protein JX266_009556 [Neoarthrinium moseri]|nr:hypothetical protein JX266_009556 [Neoarthrinium moseri]